LTVTVLPAIVGVVQFRPDVFVCEAELSPVKLFRVNVRHCVLSGSRLLGWPLVDVKSS
jgi:hypothetical protein